ARRRPPALLRLRAPLFDPAGTRRHLPRPLQRRRTFDGAYRLCRGPRLRPDRKETVLSRLPRFTGADVRHARMRSALLLLPELGYVAGAARSASHRAAAPGDGRADGR